MPNNEDIAKKIELSPLFKMSFIAVIGFTLIFFIACLYISSQGQLNPSQGELFTTCSTLVKMGFGAIVGLISGKQL